MEQNETGSEARLQLLLYSPSQEGSHCPEAEGPRGWPGPRDS